MKSQKIWLIISDGDDGTVTTAYATQELAEANYLVLIEQVYGKTFDTYLEAREYCRNKWDEFEAWVVATHLITEEGQ